MVPASVIAKSCVDVGRPLLVSYNSARSNGRNQALDPGYARRFIESVDPQIIDALPIAGVYTSHHNVVAYDLVSAAARCPPGSTPELNMPNLLHRVREDLAAVEWTNGAERDEQYARLVAAEAAHGVVDRRARPSLRRKIGAAVGRIVPGKTAAVYRSPVEAARAADQYYSRAVEA
jgi:hypothetical protein